MRSVEQPSEIVAHCLRVDVLRLRGLGCHYTVIIICRATVEQLLGLLVAHLAGWRVSGRTLTVS
jgi:hypothetical protein